MNDRAFILTFLRELAANNHKAWMDQHRADYQQARLDFIALLRELLGGLQQFEPEARDLTPTDVLYRLHKNDRSQRDPEIYKRHFSAGLKLGGRRSPWAGYFVVLEPGGESYVGAGSRSQISWPASGRKFTTTPPLSGPCFRRRSSRGTSPPASTRPAPSKPPPKATTATTRTLSGCA